MFHLDTRNKSDLLRSASFNTKKSKNKSFDMKDQASDLEAVPGTVLGELKLSSRC